jgi:hypothetical protein
MTKSKFLIIIFALPLILFGIDSLNIRVIGSWPYCESRNVIPTEEGFTYLSVGAGIWVFNTSNPQNPIRVGELPLLGSIRNMVRKGRYLYTTHSSGGMSIVDISNPTQPQRVSYYNLYDAWSVAVDSDYAYIASFDTFYILNISNPAQPFRVSATPISGWGWDIFYAQGRVYVCVLLSGFIVYDVQNPSSPVELGRWMSQYLGCYDIWVKDSFAYVANMESLRILTVANPQNIRQVGVWGILFC